MMFEHRGVLRMHHDGRAWWFDRDGDTLVFDKCEVHEGCEPRSDFEDALEKVTNDVESAGYDVEVRKTAGSLAEAM